MARLKRYQHVAFSVYASTNMDNKSKPAIDIYNEVLLKEKQEREERRRAMWEERQEKKQNKKV